MGATVSSSNLEPCAPALVLARCQLGVTPPPLPGPCSPPLQTSGLAGASKVACTCLVRALCSSSSSSSSSSCFLRTGNRAPGISASGGCDVMRGRMDGLRQHAIAQRQSGSPTSRDMSAPARGDVGPWAMPLPGGSPQRRAQVPGHALRRCATSALPPAWPGGLIRGQGRSGPDWTHVSQPPDPPDDTPFPENRVKSSHGPTHHGRHPMPRCAVSRVGTMCAASTGPWWCGRAAAIRVRTRALGRGRGCRQVHQEARHLHLYMHACTRLRASLNAQSPPQRGKKDVWVRGGLHCGLACRVRGPAARYEPPRAAGAGPTGTHH